MNLLPATFAAVFAVLYVAHSVGDHWIQTSAQAATKGRPGLGRPSGRCPARRHSDRHQGGAAGPGRAGAAPAPGVSAGRRVAVAASTHWWADRRSTLAALARITGNSEFYELGTPAHPAAPATATGGYAPTIGTGAYALDQSWHHLWLLVAALLITAV